MSTTTGSSYPSMDHHTCPGLPFLLRSHANKGETLLIPPRYIALVRPTLSRFPYSFPGGCTDPILKRIPAPEMLS